LIPVLLLLAYPPGYPGPGPIRAPQLRASDADRDTTVDILCAAVGDGRLTLTELDERVGAALSARTVAQLAALIADLPGRRRASLAQRLKPADDAVDRSRRGERLRPGNPGARSGPPTPSRWSLIQSLIDAWASPGSPSRPIGSMA
jgi:Domain of unknown function (DUF1707)